MIRPVLVDKRSPLMGEECALCKQPLAPGDEVILCPEDAARHHVHCWRANNNKCSAYGCRGQGVVSGRSADVEPRRRPRVIEHEPAAAPRSKVRVMPSSNFGCAHGCLLFSLALAILMVAVGCFGLWAIADYIMMEILQWHYRAPISSILPLLLPAIS